MKFPPVLTFISFVLFDFCLGVGQIWLPKNRFSGIRFEIHLKKIESAPYCKIIIKKTIQQQANQFACFGWVQESAFKGTVVGEARCNKQMGYQMKRFLHGDTQNAISESRKDKSTEDTSYGIFKDCIDTVEIKDYEDTKIKLHFSHFKILHKSRETCFRDTPHQCDHSFDLI